MTSRRFLALAASAGAARAAEPGCTLAAVGDVLLARGIPPRIRRHGPGWLWERLADRLARADLVFANLEGSIGDAAPTDGGRRPRFVVEGDLAASALAAGRVRLLSLANNHSLDAGPGGLARTAAWADAHGFAHAGLVHADRDPAGRITIGGLRIAMRAYATWLPAPAADGEWRVALADEEALPGELAAARAGADGLVVSLHWGHEGVPAVTAHQRRLAQVALDAGADVVLGHGPHVAQRIDSADGHVVAYSLGNAVFDDDRPRTSNGLLASIRLTTRGAALSEAVGLRLREGRPWPEDET